MSSGRKASLQLRRRNSGQITLPVTIPQATKLKAMLTKKQICACMTDAPIGPPPLTAALFDPKNSRGNPSEQAANQYKRRRRQNCMIVTVDIRNAAQHDPKDCAEQQATKKPSNLPIGHVVSI
jgi:hypothetical protein